MIAFDSLLKIAARVSGFAELQGLLMAHRRHAITTCHGILGSFGSHSPSQNRVCAIYAYKFASQLSEQANLKLVMQKNSEFLKAASAD
jgi:hypothetical protein